MRRLIKIIAVVIGVVAVMCMCTACMDINSNSDKVYEIPQSSISYVDFEIGNVIDEGKQAVFFNFVSDFPVKKIEAKGTLYDKDGGALQAINISLSFATPSRTPEPVVRVEAGLVKYIASVSFSEIKAYTTEKIS